MELKLAQGFAVEIEAAAGETRRTISGIAVPYNVAATVTDGTTVMFTPGSLPVEGKAPKLFMYHDSTQPVWLVTGRTETADGMMFTASVVETQAGDEALTLAKAGVLDSVSVGVNATDFYRDKNGTLVITAADWVELSLVPVPAFSGANITNVAAAEGDPNTTPDEATENESVEEETTMIEETPIEASGPEPVVPTVFAQARRDFKLPSVAEYICAMRRGGADFAQFQANVRAAAPDVVTDDLPGIVPVVYTQQIYNNFRGLRPVIDASGARAMPSSGKVFIRPVVTTHTSIGGGQVENQPITQSTFVVTDVPVEKSIFGGFADVSEASIDWSQPEVLGAMLDDMARVYANETDAAACTELETCTQTEPLADFTDPADWITFVYGAASQILTNSNGNLPTHLYLAPGAWQAAGSVVDGQGRPLFPQVGPMNAYGQTAPGSYNGNAFGLTVVLDRNLSTDQVIVGDPSGFEAWEDMRGVVQVRQPSTLSIQLAFRGYAAFKLIDDTKFVKVGA